ERRRLDDRADARQCLVALIQALAEQPDRSRAGGNQAEQHTDGCALSRPVRPEEAIDLAASHLEAHVIDSGDSAVALGQVIGADDRLGRALTSSLVAPAWPAIRAWCGDLRTHRRHPLNGSFVV